MTFMAAMQVSSKQHMNVLVYHGKRKDMITSAASLASYSVVITSFNMLGNECGSVSSTKGGGELVDLASDDEDAGMLHLPSLNASSLLRCWV